MFCIVCRPICSPEDSIKDETAVDYECLVVVLYTCNQTCIDNIKIPSKIYLIQMPFLTSECRKMHILRVKIQNFLGEAPHTLPAGRGVAPSRTYPLAGRWRLEKLQLLKFYLQLLNQNLAETLILLKQ